LRTKADAGGGGVVPELKNVRSVLAVNDLKQSVAFYREKLGFTVDFEVDGWSFLSRGQFRLMLGHCPDAVPVRQINDHSWFAYVIVDAIDDLHREFRDRGVAPLRDAEDKPWGLREFVVTTPDGHRIAFGQELNRS
jgi:catechol 2,3-dioxygenase-like lactoylglutathione lyase family enzyme